MSNVGALVEQTRRLLFGSHNQQLNKLGSTITAVATTITTTYNLNGAVAGASICIGDELLYVWEAVPSTKTLTVSRGWLGTTPAIHTANDVIEINPRFSTPVIRQALQDELRSWPPEIFKVQSQDVLVGSDTRLIDMSAFGKVIQVLRVTRPPTTTETAWRRVPFDMSAPLATIIRQVLSTLMLL